MGRVIVVGDVHGCIDELLELVDELRLAPEDRLISVGDLVGKGPDGAAVVRFFREGGHEAVRGNHDDKVLRWKNGKRRRPLRGSHREHADAMSDADWEWLSALPLSIDLPEHDAIVVHAGLVPGVALDEQEARWLMNLRSIRADGSPTRKLDEGDPWASKWLGPPRVIFGHDAIRGLQRWPHALGLDTGCVYGGYLSALVLPDNRVVRQRARRAYEQPAAGPLRVCRADELDRVHAAPWGRDEEGRPREALFVRTEQGEIRAWLNRCEHLPIPLDGGSREYLDQAQKHLMCGTHGALYRLDDGYCFEGPCRGTSLEAIPFRVDDSGWIIIDIE